LVGFCYTLVLSNREFQEGDIVISTPTKEGKFYAFKILKIDTWPDHSRVWHVLTYKPFDHEPSVDEAKTFSILSWHSPIASFESTAKLIIHSPVTKEDLHGFMEYLKLTDYDRYIREGGKE